MATHGEGVSPHPVRQSRVVSTGRTWLHDDQGMAGVLAGLLRECERPAVVRTKNVTNSPRWHDWSVRWSQVLCSSELPRRIYLRQRAAVLTARADMVDLPAEVRTPTRRCIDEDLIG